MVVTQVLMLKIGLINHFLKYPELWELTIDVLNVIGPAGLDSGGEKKSSM